MRPPAKEHQAIVRLREHPAIWDGKVTDTAILHHAVQFSEVMGLSRAIADMFDDMIADDHIEAGIRER